MALYDIARTTAPATALALGPLLPGDKDKVRVLDVGGGHGAYSLALAQLYPGLEAVIFELPAAAEIAREIIAGSEVKNRVTVQTGDFKLDSLGSGFDLALLFGVLVSETQDSAIALLTEVYRALNPGALTVIRGNYLNEDRAGPLDATLFDLHMLLSNNRGGSHTLARVKSWLVKAGFEQPETLNLPAPDQFSLLVARKPPFIQPE